MHFANSEPVQAHQHFVPSLQRQFTTATSQASHASIALRLCPSAMQLQSGMVVFQPFGQSPLRSTTFVATACTAAPRTKSIHPTEGLNNIAAGMRKVSGSDYVTFSPLARVLVTRVVPRYRYRWAFKLQPCVTSHVHPPTHGRPRAWPMVPAMRHRPRAAAAAAGKPRRPAATTHAEYGARTAALAWR